jgi:polyphenol oxidase
MASKLNSQAWIAAKWGAPDRVKAGVTTRAGGNSLPPYDALNLATHVGDDPATVTRNRSYVSGLLQLPSEPIWLNQIHGNRIVCAEKLENNTADGTYTDQTGLVCTVMTADCVPVLLCNATASRVAAVHVGWKGFCADILENALELYFNEWADMFVWIGPHIHQRHYEVGNDVRDDCLAKNHELAGAFLPNSRGRWQADLETMLCQQLQAYGISRITSANLCTYGEPDLFYSYRRDGQTGRMASMIWIDQPA